MNERSGLSFTTLWSDDDLIEFQIEASDGQSVFRNRVYAEHGQLEKLLQELEAFKSHVHGGIYDIELGKFGPEYASGALHVRLQYQERGLLYLTVNCQSEFRDFGRKNVASEATLYISTEPALLDNFISEFAALRGGREGSARLPAI